ncbi:hypothetical protein DTO271D3_2115 [Paecilomyces variotii]|nr:hypothetical protein DTO271D3_2115 [Paecilomyces variotii]
MAHRRQPDVDIPLQADEGMSDADSAFASIDGANSTSISSSVLNYKYENGRRYHAYREGAYLLPNDDTEQNRLDLGHHVCRLVLGGYLYRAPITQTPRRVLDIGTGTGIWAIDMADEFPNALIIGTDLSPIQPTWVPPNCRFYVDDVESDWTFPPDEKFDFIHGRGMAGGIGDWSRLYRQAYEHLVPGGWIEMQEYESEAHSDDGTLETTQFIRNWQDMINDASERVGKNFNEAPSQRQRLIDAGFVDVRDDIYKVPLGLWPKDIQLKEIGQYNLLCMLEAVEPYTLAVATRVMNMPAEEVQHLIAGVKAEFQSRKHHLYSKFHFVYGRKPL